MQGQIALITPIELPDVGGGSPPAPSHPIAGFPSHPIELPPLPPGVEAPSHPIVPPSGGEAPSYPIFIPGTPEHPIVAPPGTVWPPLDPSDGVAGKALILAWVVGTKKYRWVVVEVPTSPEHPWVPPSGGGRKPPAAQPK